MAILRDRPGKRRRVLAAPFVVTALLTPGCAGSSQSPPAQSSAAASGESAGPNGGTAGDTRVITNPPPPAHPAPPGKGEWREADGRWTFAYPNGDRIVVADDGTCTYVADSECRDDSGDSDRPPVVVDCNPPPPRAVACPAGLPAPAGKSK